MPALHRACLVGPAMTISVISLAILFLFSALCRLLVRLDMYALQEREVAGDGNCQVSSCWPGTCTGTAWTSQA